MRIDRDIQKECLGIKIRQDGEKRRNTTMMKQRENARWEAPEEGWIKVNVDGATKINLGKSGVGCIVRDQNGET